MSKLETARTTVQLAIVIAACVAGFLSRPALDPARTVDGRAAPARFGPTPLGGQARPPRATTLPLSGWRRPDGDRSAEFQPTVVNLADMPVEPVPPEPPRDDEWAAPMERMITETIAPELADVFPDVLVEEVRCSRARCSVELRTPPELRDRVNAFRANVIPMGPRVRPEFGPDWLRFDIDLTQFGEAADWKRWYEERRAARRDRIAAIIAAEKEGRAWPPDRP